jgi:hypothetical protein
VGCQNSVRVPRNRGFADGTQVLKPHRRFASGSCWPSERCGPVLVVVQAQTQAKPHSARDSERRSAARGPCSPSRASEAKEDLSSAAPPRAGSRRHS